MKTLHLLLLLATLAVALPAHAARLALVIGNRDYSVGPLKNPINDAEAMSRTLSGLGFSATLIKNLKRDDIGPSVERFVSRIKAGDDVVVFYAGHGLQVKGVNYLPAVDANIRVESDVALNSLNLNQLLDRLDEAKSGVRLLLIDACRDNPYSRSFRSSARGLARVEGAPSGTLMHFATRPGGVAADGSGGNGLYTSELLKHLKTPGLAVESMLKRVAAGVKQASGGDQQPWTEGALDGEFYFAQDHAGQTGNAAQVASARPQPPQPQQAAQLASAAPPPAGRGLKDCSNCPELVVIPAGAFTMGSSEKEQTLLEKKKIAVRETPQHRVNIQSFAAGKYAVTKAEFGKFVTATAYKTDAEREDGCTGWTGSELKKDKAYNWRNVGYKQGEDHPVVCVSWNDAKAYAQWISQTSGKAYRLLSEAEREYVARAGTQTAFWWGDNITTTQANYDGTGKNDNAGAKAEFRPATVAVGSYKPNPFGLYNVHGNVWEWVEDCLHDNYSAAPTDASAWTTQCSTDIRVLRGGAWNATAAYLRSAHRGRGNLNYRGANAGFRLARAL